MYKNKNADGTLNRSGKSIKNLRMATIPYLSQRALADKLQLFGLDVDKNVIQRIESGERFVTDIELVYFAEVFQVSVDDLLR